jgi:mono/diheme cytochrome c family protein
MRNDNTRLETGVAMRNRKNNRTQCLSVALFSVSSLLSAFAHAGQQGHRDDWSSLRSGKDVYSAACASCHGIRGAGADATLLGFEPSPPDFTDCKFTSRETSSDWVGIAWGGGPMKGFSRMMPAFGEALSREQLEAVVAHVKEFCPDKQWPPGEFNLPKSFHTGKAFPEDEVAWSVSSTFDSPVSAKAKFVVARRISDRHQLEASIPLEVKQVSSQSADGQTSLNWGGGAGDIAVAWKSVLWFSRRTGSIASVTLDVLFPTGDEKDEVGDGILAFEPAVAIGQIIPRVGFIQLQGGAELSTNPSRRKHGLFWRGAIGRTFRSGGFGRAFSPMLEILGAKVLDATAKVEWEVVPQFQIALSQRQHIRLGTGLLIPLTEFKQKPMKLMFYLVWDWYDGGFTEGWTR